MKRSAFNSYLDRRDFAGLFITEMGWNNPSGSVNLPSIEVDGVAYKPVIVAQRNGFRVLTCTVDSIPPTSVCRRIDIKLRQYSNEYILIFTQNGSETHHLWLAPVKKVEKRDIVTTEYASADQAEFIWQKIDNLTFGYDEVTTIVDVRERVEGCFAVNSEKVTKSFYTSFTKEHKAFAALIKGIEGTTTTERDRQWYASVMLNRLMFCYFIQKKGFLDSDKDYLRRRFDAHVAGELNGTFFRSFYLDFLRSLFVNGLNDPRHNKEFEARFGKIPYLNGGMFDTHKIERDYADLDIADEAFDRLFAFFDKWNWHLDTRVTASGRDINPDVLGYIFEQYINDRAQMGAYYTKEDITEYIGRNCILPFLFDATKNATADSAAYFAPDGFVWNELRRSGDRYIFDAVKHGYAEFDKIPENIRRGIITDDMRREYAELSVNELPEGHVPLAELRKDWNARTPERWGLPTEIWRETIERLQRCGTILDKIAGGEITSINDFITYNLDIRQFAQDLLATADRRFVRWFYKALQNVTILDPTCGSGAFLFAALNILEPLYEICIDRMQDFNRENPNYFKDELGEISDKYRSNIQYFIYKSIILRNLYGVDIMVEATEIAKLRLFLKMVAVVDVDRRADNMGLDPLPDIDFNIRCGNTLVGYATEAELNRDLNGSTTGSLEDYRANLDFKEAIEEEMEKVKDTYNLFRDIQLNHGDDLVAFKQAKHDLNERLAALNEQLNRRLHTATSTLPYDKWLDSHQPFHWLAEFYQIIHANGGFDVIIGNPPYVEYSSVKRIYQVPSFDCIQSSNLYSFVIERCYNIINSDRYLGMIIPISAFCTARMESFMRVNIKNAKDLWISNYAERPGKLFEGAERNLSILISNTLSNSQCTVRTTHYIKWKAENRSLLFHTIPYAETSGLCSYNGFPKCNNKAEISIYSRLLNLKTNIGSYISPKKNDNILFYKNSGGRYWKFMATFKPVFYLNGTLNTSSRETHLYFNNNEDTLLFTTILNSSLYYWNYVMNSDARTNNPSDLKDFPINISVLSESNRKKLLALGQSLMQELQNNAIMVNAKYRTGDVVFAQYSPALSKPLIDEIDKVLAKHYGFTEEELDFIINYDIKYRMGDELNGED